MIIGEKAPLCGSVGGRLKMNRTKNIAGKRFGKLVVRESRGYRSPTRKEVKWLCLCDCGSTIITLGTSLRNQKTKSCGCNRFLKGKFNHTWKGFGNINGRMWQNYKKNAKIRQIKFSLSIQYAWKQFQKQKEKCALSGVPIQFQTSYKKENGPTTASLDRINSSKGYCPNNIQWVHKDVNLLKRDMSQSEFIEWCRKITKNQL